VILFVIGYNLKCCFIASRSNSSKCSVV